MLKLCKQTAFTQYIYTATLEILHPPPSLARHLPRIQGENKFLERFAQVIYDLWMSSYVHLSIETAIPHASRVECQLPLIRLCPVLHRVTRL